MKKKIIIAACIIVIVLVGITGLNISTNYRQLQIRKEIIESEKISDKLNGTLIAYFSDLYFGEFCDLDMVNNLVTKINAFNPEAVIFSGDLLSTTDLNQEQQNALIEQLSSIKCHYGKYAVLGDNDLISNEYKNLVTYILTESGFDIIDNTNRIISKDMEDKINIVGLGNMLNGSANIETAFNGISSDNYTFVVTHCPDSFNDVDSRSYDYMLCGHSLGGKIRIPLISWLLQEEGSKNYYHGKIHKDEKTMDITSGVGTYENSARLNADPEIVFYSLRSR